MTTNRRYIAEVSHANAHASTEEIRQRSSILREQIDSGAIKLVTAIFNVDTGLVSFDL